MGSNNFLLITDNVPNVIKELQRKGYEEKDEEILTSDTDEIFKVLINEEERYFVYADSYNILKRITKNQNIKKTNSKIYLQ